MVDVNGCPQWGPSSYSEVSMKKFQVYRLCTALAALAAVVIASGAGHKI
jgi:hypothetical protein